MIDFRKVRFWRRVYLVFSIFLGIFTPLYCVIVLSHEFNPFTDPISRFGIEDPTWLIWDITVLILAIAIYLNSTSTIKYVFSNRDKSGSFLHILLIISAVSLSFVALISMNYLIHDMIAFIFFAVYNFYVFMFGLLRMYKDINKGFFSVVMSVLMLLCTLLLIPFDGMGIFEISYASCVMFWNIIIFIKRIKEK